MDLLDWLMHHPVESRHLLLATDPERATLAGAAVSHAHNGAWLEYVLIDVLHVDLVVQWVLLIICLGVVSATVLGIPLWIAGAVHASIRGDLESYLAPTVDAGGGGGRVEFVMASCYACGKDSLNWASDCMNPKCRTNS